MARTTRDILKTYFETGDKPSEVEFAELIDSFLSFEDDGDPRTYRPTTEPSITATVLTIDCNSRSEVIVEPTPRPETSNFSIVFSNVTNTDVVQVVLQLTGTIIITMPSNVKVSIPSSIGVWDNILKTLTMSAGTADEIGLNFLWNKSGLFWDLAVGEVAL